jgi:hypothetical protein
MALLIMIFGVASAIRTPTDTFPNINIPVVRVIFSYTGLPPDDAGQGVAANSAPAFAAVDELRRMRGMDREAYARIAPWPTKCPLSGHYQPLLNGVYEREAAENEREVLAESGMAAMERLKQTFALARSKR